MSPVFVSSMLSLFVAAMLLLAVWRNRSGGSRNSAADRMRERSERNLRQRPDDLTVQKVPDWNGLVSRRRSRGSARGTVMDIFSGARKPPQPARPALDGRADRAYPCQDAGDLSDPYQGRSEQAIPAATHLGAARKLY